MGFRWKKRDGRNYLIHRKDIAIKRIEYLSSYMEAKKEGKEIIFLDETWTFRNGCGKTRDQVNNNPKSCSVRTKQTSARYIILHAGGRGGYVPGAGLIQCTKLKCNKEDDYHGDMNAEMFQKWFVEQLTIVAEFGKTQCHRARQCSVSFSTGKVLT